MSEAIITVENLGKKIFDEALDWRAADPLRDVIANFYPRVSEAHWAMAVL